MKVIYYILLFVLVLGCKKTDKQMVTPAVKKAVDNSAFIDRFDQIEQTIGTPHVCGCGCPGVWQCQRQE